MIVDLSGTNYHFPQHIAITASRPDIMLWQDEPRVVNLVELTWWSSPALRQTFIRREEGNCVYMLKSRAIGLPSEVGSRGVLNVAGLDKIKCLLGVGRATFLTSVSRTAIVESHKIWEADFV